MTYRVFVKKTNLTLLFLVYICFAYYLIMVLLSQELDHQRQKGLLQLDSYALRQGHATRTTSVLPNMAKTVNNFSSKSKEKSHPMVGKLSGVEHLRNLNTTTNQKTDDTERTKDKMKENDDGKAGHGMPSNTLRSRLRQQTEKIKMFNASDEQKADLLFEWKPPPDAGEMGLPVVVDKAKVSKEQMRRIADGQERHHFNQFVSDLISLHRSLPRVREVECRSQQYRSDLPSTSVVIIFHNEAWSTLLRTVHSVLDRSPPHLLLQVILVDDCSDFEYLKQPLEDYVLELDKVKVVRSPSRQGLIRARILGLSYVTATTVTFLDSHCECAEGWLEPLLDRIASDSTTVVVPVIENIDKDTFEMKINSPENIQVGTFTWGLTFDWMPMQRAERLRRRSPVEPIRTPTMAGGLFVIDVAYFHKLGTYDPEMLIWGGENLELSFKIWMCGGTLETIPCSRVGHVFRTSSPYSLASFRNSLTVNLGRVAAVWLDDFSYYTHMNTSAAVIGDVSERRELRRRLQCHSFAWFLKNVLPEIHIPADRLAHGPIKNKMSGLCISRTDEQILLDTCNKPKGSRFRQWQMNSGEWAVFQRLLAGRVCLDYSGSGNIVNIPCHEQGGNQAWKYSEDDKLLQHVVTELCAEVSGSPDSPQLVMSACRHGDPRQQWEWDTSPLPGPSWRRDVAEGRTVL